MKRTTINISKETLNRIKKLGTLEDTHEDVIKKLLDYYEKGKGD